MGNIPLLDFGGKGEVIHFAHANGYPPGAYRQLLEQLSSKYRVLAILLRPLQENSDYSAFNSWEELADDIISTIESYELKPVVGMGHSLGAVATAIAAYKRPDLFSRLVLIDPVLYPKYVDYMGKFVPMSMRKNIIPIAKKALNRKSEWYSKENAFQSYRQKDVFRRMSDDALWDYIHAGTRKDPKTGLQKLRYSKEWEARIYSTVLYVFDKLLELKLPIYAIRGEETDVIKKDMWEKWKASQTQNHFLNVAFASHLVPMEYPEVISKWLIDYL